MLLEDFGSIHVGAKHIPLLKLPLQERALQSRMKIIISMLRINATEFDKVEPEILVDEEMDLLEFGVDGRIVHTPGHTAGSISLCWIPERRLLAISQSIICPSISRFFPRLLRMPLN